MKRFRTLVPIFVKKDWAEFRTPILALLASSFGTLAVAGTELAGGLALGLLLAAPFLYAHSCFYLERQHGTLDLLLSLPIERRELVLVKYASLFTMTSFTVSLPVLLLGDLYVLFAANGAALFLSALFMAPAVISSKPWAGQVPFLMIVGTALAAGRLLDFSALARHPTILIGIAYLLTPAVVAASAWLFSRRND